MLQDELKLWRALRGEDYGKLVNERLEAVRLGILEMHKTICRQNDTIVDLRAKLKIMEEP